MAGKSIYDLDDYCLSTIFELLPINDWMNLSLTTKRFQEIVRYHVIPRQVIHVDVKSDLQSAKALLQVFGKHITKISLSSTLKAFLQMLLQYFEPGMLKEVTLIIQNGKPISPDLFTRTATYFKNVTSLKIVLHKYDACTSEKQWLASIPDQQIHSLILEIYSGTEGCAKEINEFVRGKVNDLQSAKALLQTFGKHITKISLSSTLKAFLQMLLQYCESGMLKEVTLIIQNGKPISPDLFTRTATYFKNVTSLKIVLRKYGAYTQEEQWLASIPDQQIRSLHIRVAGATCCELNPDSFPNIRELIIEFYWRTEGCAKKIIEFLRGKVYLELFYCYGLEAEVVKFVAHHFPNIKVLGDIDLNANPGEINFSQLPKLEGIAVSGNLNNYREFEDIVKIARSQNTLKSLAIYLRRKITLNFLTLAKSKYNREKIHLENLTLFSEVSYQANEAYHLFINMFNFKRLQINEWDGSEIIKNVIRDVGCLETLVCPSMTLSKEYYQELIMEKGNTNRNIGTSKRLTMHIYNANSLVPKLGNNYDPKLITLAPITNNVCKCIWGSFSDYGMYGI